MLITVTCTLLRVEALTVELPPLLDSDSVDTTCHDCHCHWPKQQFSPALWSKLLPLSSWSSSWFSSCWWWCSWSTQWSSSWSSWCSCWWWCSPYKRVLPHWFPPLQTLRSPQILDTDNQHNHDDDENDHTDNQNDDEDDDHSDDEEDESRKPECSSSP